MPTGKMVSVDFEHEDCGPDEMMLEISTPQGGVVAGNVFWCMEGDEDTEIGRLQATLERIFHFATDSREMSDETRIQFIAKECEAAKVKG